MTLDSAKKRPEFSGLQRKSYRLPVTGHGIIRLSWFRRIRVEARDVSPGGARIVVPENTKLPEEFLIKLPQFNYPRRSVVRWQSGCETGIEFIAD